MQRFFILILLCGFAAASATAHDGTTVVPATLRSVMVYRSGAEMVHTASTRLEQGNNEVVLSDVSTSIDEASIRIACTGNVTIMSVTILRDYLKPEVASPLVRKLQDSIASLKKELERLDVLRQTDIEQLDLLNANKGIGSSAGVTVAELSKMLDYYRQKGSEVRTDLSIVNDKIAQARLLTEKLDSEVKEHEKKNSKAGGSLVLQLLSPMAENCDLTITYLTTAAHWEPSYDLKVAGAGDPLHLLYKARLVQTSGIDWKQVKMSLSTATPSQGGNAPVVRTRFLQFVNPFANALAGAASGVQLRGTASLQDVVVVGYGVAKRDVSSDNDFQPSLPLYIVNGKEVSAAEYGRIDKRAIKTTQHLTGSDATAIYGSRAAGSVYIVTLKDELGDYVSVNDKQMDVVFDIDIPYDVPGNGKEEGVVLKEYALPCSYQYFSAPGQDKDAYLLGQLRDWEKLSLLPGEANIIVEGTFVGKSHIDPNSTRDTLDLTLGRDKRIAIHREKVVDYSSIKFLGSSKKQVFTFEITVKNNKKEKATLELKDQYPIPSDKDIEEELLDSGGAVVDKETGILTWKLELGAGESRKFRFSYSIKYPKDKSVNIN